MLVLTRKVHESLIVGAGLGPQRAVRLTVLQIRGNRVQLGFTAGDEVSIQRGGTAARGLGYTRGPHGGR